MKWLLLLSVLAVQIGVHHDENHRVGCTPGGVEWVR